MGKLNKILNLRQGEGRIVLYLFVYSFFVGAALAFFVTSSTALFLTAFKREMLPLSFIVAGVLVWVTGKGLKYLQHRFEFTKSLPSGLAVLLVSVVVLLFLYKIYKPVFIIFLFYAWIRIFAYIHAVTFWSLAGRLFSLQQAKRVFGLITAGEVVASIISFFSVPFLLKFLLSSDILLISGLFLTVGFLILLFIVAKYKQKLSLKKVSSAKPQKTSIKFSAEKYFKLFFLIAFIPIFAQFFVDFIFQAQAKLEFPNREELTAFVGIFFGLSAVIEFVLKTFVSGRVMTHYGLKVALIVFPLMLFISFFLAVMSGLFAGVGGVFFSFVALGRLFTRSVRTSFNDPATQILYQPLPKEQRLAFQNKIESGPKAYASIVAGVVLLGFSQIHGLSLIVFSFFLLLITLFWIKVVSDIFTEYKIKIQDALASIDNENVKDENIETDNVLTEKNNVNLQVFFCSRKITDVEDKQGYKLSQIVDFVNSDDTDKRIIASMELIHYSIFKTEKLFIKLLNDNDYVVRCNAILNAGISKHSRLFEFLVANFKNKMYREAAFNAFLKVGDEILKDLAVVFHSAENDIDLQIRIIDVFEYYKTGFAIDFLKKMASHPNRIIVDKVFDALYNIASDVENIDTDIVATYIERKLASFVYLTASLLDLQKNKETENLRNAIRDKKERQKIAVYKALSLIYNKKSIDLIKDNLEKDTDDQKAFAIEIADTVLSEYHKQLLLPFFEANTDEELVKRYKNRFVTGKMSPNIRIIDIINADITDTGFYLKVECLKLLTAMKDKQLTRILKVNILHPLTYISEVAALNLFFYDPDLYSEYFEIQQQKYHRLKKLNDKILRKNKQANMLIYEKIDLIKGLQLFDNLSFIELYDLAVDAVEFTLAKGQKINIANEQNEDVFFIVSGSVKNEQIEFKDGDFFGRLIPYKNSFVLNVEEQTFFLKLKFFTLNKIFYSNKFFAHKIINYLQKL